MAGALEEGMVILLAVSLSVCATSGNQPVPGATVVLVNAAGGAAALVAGADGCVVTEVEPGAFAVTVASADGMLADVALTVPAEGLATSVALRPAGEVHAEPAGAAAAGGDAKYSVSQEVVVTAKRERVEETRRVISPELARNMPGASGDALKAVQNLPGLSRTPFGMAGLVVRGAAPQDTKVFLDGQEIPQLYHFGGLTSVVSTDMLESIDFLPGGYGVRYGGAIAGVVDVSTKGGQAEGVAGNLDADVYDAQASVQGPAANGRVIGAVRRSYIDAVLPAIMPADAIQFTVAPRYYDYQLRYDAPSSESGRTSAVMLYGSDDMMSFLIDEPQGEEGNVRGRFLFQTRFHRVQAPVIMPLQNGWVVSLTPGAGWQQIKVDAGGQFAIDATRSDFSIRGEARGQVSPNVKTLVGIEARGWRNQYDTTFIDDVGGGPPGSGAAEENPGAARTTVNESSAYESGIGAIYAQGELEAGRLTVIPGVRIDGYLPQDTISVDPRIAARFTFDDATSVKGYAGVYHQAPQFQEWDAQIGSESLRPPYAVQTGFGGKRQLAESMSIEAEVFYKWMGDLVVQHAGDASTNGRSVYSNEQMGRAFGGEVLARRELSEKLSGFVAYTLSRSERADPYTAGGWHAFQYDQTHILTAVAAYKLRRGWQVGTRFRYVTGNPTTSVTSVTYDSDRDVYAPVMGDAGERLPAFHQLDVRFDKTWEYANGTKLGVYLDLQNAYAQQNVEGTRYDHDYEKRFWLTGLPTIPSFGIRGEF